MQVEAWEAAAHPGLTSEVPLSSREFLEVEVPATDEAGGNGDVSVQAYGTAHANTSGDSGLGARAGGGERLVIYPARNGHASYHKPKRCALVMPAGIPRARKKQSVAVHAFTSTASLLNTRMIVPVTIAVVFVFVPSIPGFEPIRPENVRQVYCRPFSFIPARRHES